jgi:hypothetical protein
MHAAASPSSSSSSSSSRTTSKTPKKKNQIQDPLSQPNLIDRLCAPQKHRLQTRQQRLSPKTKAASILTTRPGCSNRQAKNAHKK